MSNIKALRNVEYARVLDEVRRIEEAVHRGNKPVAIKDFLQRMEATLGRKISENQVDLCLNENRISWRDVFRPRSTKEASTTAQANPVEVQALRESDDWMQAAMRTICDDIRLLQTHTAEILRRLPPKTTISPTQTLFSEEQPIE